jgi:2-polyprenyl-3-methyl-5-hydroxy-6-metoxy-1,4-benzoquinol methylase
MARPVIEEAGIPVGNVYDKYGTRNPLARLLVAGFLDSVLDLVHRSGARQVHEVGCGEGNLSNLIARAGVPDVRGSDFSEQMIAEAIATHARNGLRFAQKSVYELSAHDSAELMVCCEVLEHLEAPGDAIMRLAELSRPWCVMSVPREPIWRLLNILRGKYLADLGNSPGHVQHWSRSQFLALVRQHFEIIDVRSPLPWTMVLCRSMHA